MIPRERAGSSLGQARDAIIFSLFFASLDWSPFRLALAAFHAVQFCYGRNAASPSQPTAGYVSGWRPWLSRPAPTLAKDFCAVAHVPNFFAIVKPNLKLKTCGSGTDNQGGITTLLGDWCHELLEGISNFAAGGRPLPASTSAPASNPFEFAVRRRRGARSDSAL